MSPFPPCPVTFPWNFLSSPEGTRSGCPLFWEHPGVQTLEMCHQGNPKHPSPLQGTSPESPTAPECPQTPNAPHGVTVSPHSCPDTPSRMSPCLCAPSLLSQPPMPSVPAVPAVT